MLQVVTLLIDDIDIVTGCLILFFFYQSKDVNIDYLSGVLNRRGLDIKLQQMVKNSIALGKDFCAIMIDIDNFKYINDSLGHAAGDKAIKVVADNLVDIFGADSYIGRFGGDEFCVVVEDMTKAEVSKKVETFKGSITKAKRRYNWPKNVGVSCGYEEYNHGSGVDLMEFQQTIDRLMYIEKQKHHNKSLKDD